jgi:non-specific serine/threonine protein kinase
MIGHTISHYKILEKLGEGGMGVVYKALDTKLDRTVALKFLPPHLSINQEEKKRFIHEAKAAAALDHPNICTVHEIGETDEGQLFIVMGYYEGKILRDKIASGPLPLAEAMDIAIQIAEGLNNAHQKDIVHRDIKSANIIITDEGVAKTLDFGLAKLRGVTKLTKEGTTLGTVSYMSPEQASGEKVDHRSDIWSLGVMLYEMVTGQLPFKGEYEQAVMYAILNEKPEPVTGVRTGVSLELEKIIQKALSKDISERYQNIEDLMVDLKKQRKSVIPHDPELKSAMPKKPIQFLLVPGIILLIIIIIAGYFILKEKSQSEEPGTRPTSAIQETIDTAWKNSIAVLPFANISADKDQEYFCDGMTEDIITKLAHIKDLKVISRTSVMNYKNSKKNIKEIGKELDVDNILEGSVRREKHRIRITAQLIRVTDDAHLWANKYDRNLESIFAVQDEVSKAIAQALEVTLTPETVQAFKAGQTKNLEAYEYYLKGMHLFNTKYLHTFDEEDFSTAVKLLETALEIDPNYLGAYSGLAWFYTNNYIYRRNESDFDLALKLSLKIRKMAPDSAEGYASLGVIYNVKQDFDRAYKHLKTAVAKTPNSARVNFGFGWFFHRLGLYQLAFKYCTRAMELDPLFLHPYMTTIRDLIYSGNYIRAEYYLKKASEIYPDHPRIIEFTCRLQLRLARYEEAEQSIKRLEQVYPGYKYTTQWQMILFAARGERQKALALQYQDSRGYALLDLKEEALAFIQKNQTENQYYYSYLYLINNPHYDNLRDDPRFKKIVQEARVLYEKNRIKYRDL